MTNWFPMAWAKPGHLATRMDPAAFGPNRAMADAMKNVTRFQLELWALSSRRAQAYMELPGRLARCTTPEAAAKEQQRFIQTAAHQYGDSTKRLMNAWQAAFTPPRIAAPVAEQALSASAEVHNLTSKPSRQAVEGPAAKPLRIGAPTAAAPEERKVA